MNNDLISKIVESHKIFSNVSLLAKQTPTQQMKKIEKGNINSLLKIRSYTNDLFPFPKRIYQSNFLLLACLFILFGLSSCNKFFKHKEVKPALIIYPSPPDQARFQYLTKFTSSLDIEKEESVFSKMVLGNSRPKGMVKPYGIAIKKGKIYVCDNYAGGLEVIDLEKRKFDYFAPAGKGLLRTPLNCFLDEKDYLYVADAGRMQVVVFDENGNYVKSLGEKEKFKPSDVNVYENKIFVANSANSKVYVYSNDSISKLLYTIPREDDPEAVHLCMPTNIAISDGKVYAADFGCSKVKIYSTDGKFIDTLGSLGDAPGTFAKLKGIAVDKEANILCVDAAFENVQVFNKDKQFLMDFGGHFQGNGGLYLPAKIIIDYDNLKYFQKYVDPSFDLKYLIFVTSQYGPNLINVYGRVEPKVITPIK
ncbi:MAG: 6-bladed beta-propeller [Bacteroidetes bacterium]|nr:6-bladed beta-propeller [Bacteroidota bacterium]